MSVSRLTGVQLVVSFAPVFQWRCFNNPGISAYLNTLFLLGPYLCFVIGFICNLLVARNDSWMS